MYGPKKNNHILGRVFFGQVTDPKHQVIQNQRKKWKNEDGKHSDDWEFIRLERDKLIIEKYSYIFNETIYEIEYEIRHEIVHKPGSVFFLQSIRGSQLKEDQNQKAAVKDNTYHF